MFIYLYFSYFSDWIVFFSLLMHITLKVQTRIGNDPCLYVCEEAIKNGPDTFFEALNNQGPGDKNELGITAFEVAIDTSNVEVT